MANALLEPMPVTTPVVDAKSGLMTSAWQLWLMLALINRLQNTAQKVTSTSATAQSAAIGTTVLVAVASAGFYRISVYAQVVQAASSSSSLAASIETAYNNQTITQSLTAVTGNTLKTVLVGSVLAQVDAGSTISFLTTYGSVGATAMEYDMYVTAERL